MGSPFQDHPWNDDARTSNADTKEELLVLRGGKSFIPPAGLAEHVATEQSLPRDPYPPNKRVAPWLAKRERNTGMRRARTVAALVKAYQRPYSERGARVPANSSNKAFDRPRRQAIVIV